LKQDSGNLGYISPLQCEKQFVTSFVVRETEAYYNLNKSSWFFYPATREHDEVIDSISGTVNTLLKAEKRDSLNHRINPTSRARRILKLNLEL
jgi:hypothetical protein